MMGKHPVGVARPNFVVAGAARSGTTALCSMLAQHPDVFITDPKETHFLAHVGRPTVYRAPGDDVTVNRFLVTDHDRYLSLYREGVRHRIRGEGSVSTLYMADRSIPAINRFCEPDTKIVVILREPVARAYSSYLYLVGRGFEDQPTFEHALAREQDRIEGGYHHMWHLRAMSHYGQQLPAFVEAFGARFKLIIFEEYRTDPNRWLAELCRFLDIDDGFEFDTATEMNRGGVPRSDLLVKLMTGIRRAPMAQQLLRTATPQALRERVRGANLRRPEAAADTIAGLRSEFEGDIQCVEQLVDRKIESWHRP